MSTTTEAAPTSTDASVGAGAEDASSAPSRDRGPRLLGVDRLTVSYATGRQHTEVVHDVSFDLHAGEALTLVGESGSGKSTTAQAVIGLLPGNGRIDAGSIRLGSLELTELSPRELQALRGKQIGYVPQDPNNSLNPVKQIGAGLAEVLQIHRWGDRAAIRRRVVELLDRVGIPEPERRARQYPHELSGGMKQRVLIASALALNPQLVIADEPTSALDVTVQKRILDLLDELRADLGTALLLVTHDLGVAAERSNRIVVLKDGQVQEQGPVAQVLRAPRADYTVRLLADIPSFSVSPRAPRVPDAAGPPAAIRVDGLVQDFASHRWRVPPFRAVHGVSFEVPAGTTHALVGESGSGKTTTARSVLGFHRPTEGVVLVDGQRVADLRREDLRRFRRRAQLVQQNPYASLDPRQSVAEIITEPLRNFERTSTPERRAVVTELLDRVALPAGTADRHPRELSGGQRQRVAIARALVLEPSVVVLDEPVSALDVTVQAQILRLLEALQRDLGLTYLFISHDLAVVRRIADTVSVMRAGRIVEAGPLAQVFDYPRSDYTQALIDAIPARGILPALATTGSSRSVPGPALPSSPRPQESLA